VVIAKKAIWQGDAPLNEIARRLAQREPLVPLVEVDDFQGLSREMAERAMSRSGRVPNQARAMANAPDLGGVYRRLFEDLSSYATMPAGFRLLIRYKVSTLNTCLYCSAHQIKYMAQNGVAEEKVANIHQSDTHPAFDERERVALAFAQALTEDASNIPDTLSERFVALFTPAERVEISVVAAAMGCMNKINDALRIPLEEVALDIVGTGVDMTKLQAAAE